MTSIGSNPFNKPQINPAQFNQQGGGQQPPQQGQGNEFAGLSNAFKTQMSQILGHQTDYMA